MSPAFDTPPSVLDGDPVAQAEWKRLAPMLRLSGIATAADANLIIAITLVWSRYLACQAEVRKHGAVVTSGKGVPIINPHLVLAEKALNQYRKFAIELGLTPAARAPSRSKWDGLL